MSDTDGQAPDTWLTLAEAARRLNKPERTLRRRVDKLPALSVRRRTGQPTEVLLSALVEIMEPLSERPALTDTGGQVADADQREPSEVEKLLREELAYMKARVEQHEQAESELRRLMMADKNELQMLRQKVALMIAAPPVEEPSPAVESTVQDAQEGQSAKETTETGISASGTMEGAQRQETVKKSWWRRFWGK